MERETETIKKWQQWLRLCKSWWSSVLSRPSCRQPRRNREGKVSKESPLLKVISQQFHRGREVAKAAFEQISLPPKSSPSCSHEWKQGTSNHPTQSCHQQHLSAAGDRGQACSQPHESEGSFYHRRTNALIWIYKKIHKISGRPM